VVGRTARLVMISRGRGVISPQLSLPSSRTCPVWGFPSKSQMMLMMTMMISSPPPSRKPLKKLAKKPAVPARITPKYLAQASSKLYTDDDDDIFKDPFEVNDGASEGSYSTATTKKQTRKRLGFEQVFSGTEEAAGAFLLGPGKRKFGMNEGNDLDWKAKKVQPRAGGGTRQVMYCHFHNESGCGFRVEKVVGEEGGVIISIWNWDHADHTLSCSKRGVPSILKSIVTPSKLEKQPGKFIQFLRDARFGSAQVLIDKKLEANLKLWQQRQRTSMHEKGLEAGPSGTWGAAKQTCDLCELKFPSPFPVCAYQCCIYQYLTLLCLACLLLADPNHT